MKNKLILYGVMFLIVLSSVISLSYIEYGIPVGSGSLYTNGGTSYEYGMVFCVNDTANVTLNNVKTYDLDDQASLGLLNNATVLSLKNTTVTSHYATFNYNLTAGECYRLVGGPGSNHNIRLDNGGYWANFPLENNYTYMASGCEGSSSTDWTCSNPQQQYATIEWINVTPLNAEPPPTPDTDALSMNITTPISEEHLNVDFFINASTNISANCSINNTNWVNIFNNGTYHSFLNNTAIADGHYSMLVNCSLGGGSNETNASISFYIDTTSPVIVGNPDLENNQTFIYNGTLTGHINFSDNIEIYSLNITLSNGTHIFTADNVGATEYSFNISHAVPTTPSGNLTARVCDTHTANEIETLKVEYSDNGLVFVMDEFLFINREYIKIYPKEKADYSTAETSKKLDSYDFTFNKKTVSSSEVFIVESSHFIDIITSQKYKGHLVIPGIKNGYWVDFENEYKGSSVLIKRISNTKIEVTISGLGGNSITFNSIGELNCISQTFYFTNLNPITTHINDVLIGSSNDATLNITESPFITNANATFYYGNHTPIYAGATTNFTATKTAPYNLSGGILYQNFSLSWLLKVNDQTFNITSGDQRVYNKIINNCSNATINTTALNVSIENLSNSSPVLVDVIISLDGEEVSYYGAWDNISEFSICIWPPFATFTENISIQYGLDSYNYYNSVINLSNTTQYLKLYYLDTDNSVKFTIKNKDTGELLENVYITMYQYINGSWAVIESKYSDITGRSKFNYETDTEYKFFLSKSEYEDKIFILNPILFGEYDVLMTANATLNTTQDYDRVALTYYPKVFYNNLTNNITFLFASPFNEFIQYGYILTYPGGSTSNSGTASLGEELTSSFNISGADINDRLRIDYYYQIPITGIRNFTTYHAIILDEDNNTMMSLKDNTYGLGIFERLLLSVFAVLLVVGIASLIGQVIPGVFLGMAVYIYLVYTGFIPLWTVLITILIGLMVLGGRQD